MNALLVPLMTFLAVVSLGGAILALRAVRRERVQTRLHLTAASGRLPHAADSNLVEAVAKVGQAAGSKTASPSLRAKLAQAGYHAQSAAAVYLGSKVLLLIMGSSVSALLIQSMTDLDSRLKLLVIAWGGVLLFMVPNLIVERRRRKRQQQIQQNLPNTLDLLEVCVSAGMGLDLAWNSVGDEIRNVCPVLADEMALTDFEIHLNAPRAVAMRHMGERTGADEISSLAAVLVQSDRFGTSIGEALRTYATAMREARSRRAEEHAEKMVVKLLFPMILLIFPAVGVVMCGPAALRWMELISGF